MLAIGASEQRQGRLEMMGALVQLCTDAATAILQLNDPEHFNTFSNALGEDMRRAVQHVSAQPDVTSVVLQGAGPHFSVGGNPYTMRGSHVTSPAAAAPRKLRLCILFSFGC